MNINHNEVEDNEEGCPFSNDVINVIPLMGTTFAEYIALANRHSGLFFVINDLKELTPRKQVNNHTSPIPYFNLTPFVHLLIACINLRIRLIILMKVQLSGDPYLGYRVLWNNMLQYPLGFDLHPNSFDQEKVGHSNKSLQTDRYP